MWLCAFVISSAVRAAKFVVRKSWIVTGSVSSSPLLSLQALVLPCSQATPTCSSRSWSQPLVKANTCAYRALILTCCPTGWHAGACVQLQHFGESALVWGPHWLSSIHHCSPHPPLHPHKQWYVFLTSLAHLSCSLGTTLSLTLHLHSLTKSSVCLCSKSAHTLSYFYDCPFLPTYLPPFLPPSLPPSLPSLPPSPPLPPFLNSFISKCRPPSGTILFFDRTEVGLLLRPHVTHQNIQCTIACKQPYRLP